MLCYVFKIVKILNVSVKDLQLFEIGNQTEKYEDLVKKSNLLVNIDFIGKLTDSSTTKYKLNIML